MLNGGNGSKVSTLMGDSGLITFNLGTDRLQGSSKPCVINQEEVNLEGVETPKPLACGRGYLDSQ